MKIQISIPALCARVGKEAKCNCKSKIEIAMCDDGEGSGEYLGGWCYMCSEAVKILSAGDKIPEIVWECDHCEEEYAEEPEKCSKCFCSVFNPNPRLMTVKEIRLVEVCECEHSENWHYEWHGKKNCHWAKIAGQRISQSRTIPCGCKQYTPKQMVEIAVRGEQYG